MTTIMKKFGIRFIGLVVTMMVILSTTCSLLSTMTASAAGAEVLPYGDYPIGDFTFTDTNLTKEKTITSDSRAQKMTLNVRFKKASIDAGIGPVKLTVQVRRLDGSIVASGESYGYSGEDSIGTWKRYSTLTIKDIPVKPGEKFQFWFDASSINPSQSNGRYRSIYVLGYNSLIE